MLDTSSGRGGVEVGKGDGYASSSPTAGSSEHRSTGVTFLSKPRQEFWPGSLGQWPSDGADCWKNCVEYVDAFKAKHCDRMTPLSNGTPVFNFDTPLIFAFPIETMLNEQAHDFLDVGTYAGGLHSVFSACERFVNIVVHDYPPPDMYRSNHRDEILADSERLRYVEMLKVFHSVCETYSNVRLLQTPEFYKAMEAFQPTLMETKTDRGNTQKKGK